MMVVMEIVLKINDPYWIALELQDLSFCMPLAVCFYYVYTKSY